MVSQRQVADALGLSQATVSMALAGNPRVAKETRDHILAVAAQIGYKPDPALRSLARYRKRQRPAVFQSTIAWVHSWPTARAWEGSAVFHQIFRSAAQRATDLGYKLENFWIEPGQMTPARAATILQSRGIQGLILVPYSGLGEKFSEVWEKFTTVRLLSYSDLTMKSHVLAADHHAAVFHVWEEARARGYRRPALITGRNLEAHIFHSYFCAYSGLRELHREDGSPAWPEVLWYEDLTAKKFTTWVRREKPDVFFLSYVVNHTPAVLEWIHRLVRKIPEELGLIMLCLPDSSAGQKIHFPLSLSGIDENFTGMGVGAVNLLAQSLENFEYSAPVTPTRKLIRGLWVEGQTVRPRSR